MTVGNVQVTQRPFSGKQAQPLRHTSDGQPVEDYWRAMRELQGSDSLSIMSAADRESRRQLQEEEEDYDEDDEDDDKKEEGKKNEPLPMDQDRIGKEIVPVKQSDQIKLEE